MADVKTSDESAGATLTGAELIRAVQSAASVRITVAQITDRVAALFFDTDTALAANSDSKLATQKATKAHVAAAISALGLGTGSTLVKDTDTLLAANSDSRVATQKAVKAYVDAAVIGGIDAMVFRGVIDCSTNPNYPAADAGDVYKVSVAGKIGGASGPNVEAGDTLYCITDSTASGDHATVGAQWVIAQSNLDGAVTGPASSSTNGIAVYAGTTGKVLATRTAALVANDLQGDGSAADQAGFRGIPLNSQSADYTAVLADAGKCIFHPVADTTARTWTIPANASVAFPIGTAITFENDVGAGAITIAITTDTMVLVGAAGSTGSRTLAAGGRATAIKVSATRWRIGGSAELT